MVRAKAFAAGKDKLCLRHKETNAKARLCVVDLQGSRAVVARVFFQFNKGHNKW